MGNSADKTGQQMLWLLLAVWTCGAAAQSLVEPATLQNPSAPLPSRPASGVSLPEPVGGYRLGPGDEISVELLEAPEFDVKRFPVGPDGDVRLPLVGKLHAEGLSVTEFEAQLSKRLSEFIREPDPSVVSPADSPVATGCSAAMARGSRTSRSGRFLRSPRSTH